MRQVKLITRLRNKVYLIDSWSNISFMGKGSWEHRFLTVFLCTRIFMYIVTDGSVSTAVRIGHRRRGRASRRTGTEARPLHVNWTGRIQFIGTRTERIACPGSPRCNAVSTGLQESRSPRTEDTVSCVTVVTLDLRLYSL